MKAHAIMISIPAQGHLNPFIDLAMKLASKGITVTFVNTEHTHHRIATSAAHSISAAKDNIFSDACARGLDIRYLTISDGFPLDFDRELNFGDYWESLVRDFPSRAAQFVGDLIESSSSPSLPYFLVADTFSLWHSVVATKYNLVNVSFWTQPSSVFALDYYRHLLIQNGHYLSKDGGKHVINYIPGVEPISTKDLMAHLQKPDTTTIVNEIVVKAFKEVVKADFVLHNTVQELEPQTLSVLNQNQPTYAVGLIKFSTRSATVPKSLLPEADCSNWLGSKPPGSVLYISFGSIAQGSREVMQEIAQGLLLNHVNFLWVIRPLIATDVLPLGFENEVKGRGLVVPWCDQLAVLSNPAVGGFLTHCGWNSTLESIWCGVPMICYPITYDQPTNRKLVVDDWRIGINLCDGDCVNREEVAEKINMLMSGEKSVGVRNSMKKMSSKVGSAWDIEEGSSERNFNQFLKDLNDKIELAQK